MSFWTRLLEAFRPKVVAPVLVKPTVMPEFAFCAAPGAPDVAGFIDPPDDDTAVQLYQPQFMDPAPAMVGVNAWPALEGSVWGAPIDLEVYALKAYGPGEASSPEAFVKQTVNILDHAEVDAGAIVQRLMMDDPVSAGVHQAGLSVPQCIEHLRAYMRGVQEWSDAHIGLIEAFPSVGAADIVRVAEALSPLGLDCVRLDVDTNHIKNGWVENGRSYKGRADGAARLRWLREQLEDRLGIPCGVIITGCDGTLPQWQAWARDLFTLYREAFGAKWPSHVMVQSWAKADPKVETRTMPTAAQLWAFLEECRAALK